MKNQYTLVIPNGRKLMEHVQVIIVLQHHAHNYAYRANTLLKCPRLLNRPRLFKRWIALSTG